MAKAFDMAMVIDLVSVILVTTGRELGAVNETERLISSFICSAVAGSVNQWARKFRLPEKKKFSFQELSI
jgi:hypothetical protein